MFFVAFDVGCPGRFHGGEKFSLALRTSTLLKLLEQGGDFLAVLGAANQQFVDLFPIVQQKHLHGDAIIQVGVDQGFTGDLDLGPVIVDGLLQVEIEFADSAHSQPSNAGQD